MDSSIFHSKTNCLTLKSVNDMENLGANMAKIIGENCILTLSGDLGSGKTTFVRGLARGLGIQQAITSPTYTRTLR